MDLILETNALYYAANISTNNKVNLTKLKEEIKKAQHIYVSSVTIFEALHYFRNRSNDMRRLVAFIKQNQIQVLQQDLLPIKNNIIDELCKIRQEDLLDIYKKIFIKKIELEVQYTGAILNLLFFTFLFFYIGEKNSEPSGRFGSFLIEITRLIRKINEEVLFELYSSGYNSDDCDTYIKNAFYDLLEYNLQEYIPLIEPFIQAESKEDFDCLLNRFDFDEIIKSAEKIRKKIHKKPTTIIYIQKFLHSYEKNKQSNAIKGYLDEFILTNTEKIPQFAMKMLINESIQRMVKNGCSFRKNDISDRLIADHITNNRLLITFDEGFKDFCNRHSKVNRGYEDSFNLSNKLLR